MRAQPPVCAPRLAPTPEHTPACLQIPDAYMVALLEYIAHLRCAASGRGAAWGLGRAPSAAAVGFLAAGAASWAARRPRRIPCRPLLLSPAAWATGTLWPMIWSTSASWTTCAAAGRLLAAAAAPRSPLAALHAPYSPPPPAVAPVCAAQVGDKSQLVGPLGAILTQLTAGGGAKKVRGCWRCCCRPCLLVCCSVVGTTMS